MTVRSTERVVLGTTFVKKNRELVRYPSQMMSNVAISITYPCRYTPIVSKNRYEWSDTNQVKGFRHC